MISYFKVLIIVSLFVILSGFSACTVTSTRPDGTVVKMPKATAELEMIIADAEKCRIKAIEEVDKKLAANAIENPPATPTLTSNQYMLNNAINKLGSVALAAQTDKSGIAECEVAKQKAIDGATRKSLARTGMVKTLGVTAVGGYFAKEAIIGIAGVGASKTIVENDGSNNRVDVRTGTDGSAIASGDASVGPIAGETIQTGKINQTNPRGGDSERGDAAPLNFDDNDDVSLIPL